jgi:hypothetical protein
VITEESIYYGYKHYTLELAPRCFYVGRGIKGRPFDLRQRNHKHKAIVSQYGCRVEVCAGPMTFEESNSWEVEHIALEGTYTTCYKYHSEDIGCNFTLGGGGTQGCTTGKLGDSNPAKRPEIREKIANTLRGHPGANKGKNLSKESRTKISESLKGKEQSPETRFKKSQALKGRPQTCSLCGITGHKRFLCPTLPPEELQKKLETIGSRFRGKPSPNKGKVWSEEQRQRMSQARKGNVLSAEQRAHISAGLKGKQLGWKRSEKAKLHMAASHMKYSSETIEKVEKLLQQGIKQCQIASICKVPPMLVTIVKQGKHYYQRIRGNT